LIKEAFLHSVISRYKPIVISAMILAFSWNAGWIIAQNGVNIKAGPVLVGDISLASLSDTAFHHKGYHIGVDVRIGPYGFYLSPGLHYYGIDIGSTNGFEYFAKSPKYHIIKGPLNLGYKMFITRKIKFRLKAGVDVNYVLLIDDNDLNIGYNNVNDAYFGINIGVGLDMNRVTLDFNFESGLTDVLKDQVDSKFNYLTLSLGFFF
jgi:hypothetical protein